MGEAKAVVSARPKGASARGAPQERSENGGISLVRRTAKVPPLRGCGQHAAHDNARTAVVIGACSHAAFAGKKSDWAVTPAIRVRSENAMRDIIAFILGNFTLTFLSLASSRRQSRFGVRDGRAALR
jgi:hypothetical protein